MVWKMQLHYRPCQELNVGTLVCQAISESLFFSSEEFVFASLIPDPPQTVSRTLAHFG